MVFGTRVWTQGRLNQKVVPPSGGLSTPICPRCSSTNFLLIGSPRPVPLCQAEIGCSVVRKASNTLGRSWAGIPFPVSATVTRTFSPSRVIATRIQPRSVNRAAFTRRLSITWRIRSGSIQSAGISGEASIRSSNPLVWM